MSNYINIVIIFKFLFIFNKTLCVKLHSEIGEYNDRIKKDYWNPDCGLRIVPKDRETSHSSKCFAYRTPIRLLMSRNERSESDANTDEYNTRIMFGVTAGAGEAPWAVYLSSEQSPDYFCGGVILNKKWILTAAHCILYYWRGFYIGNNDRTKATKYLPDGFKKWEYPGYKHGCLDDIGLIKIKEEIKFNIVNNTYTTNSVCLPEMGIKNTREELATMYGWGTVHDTGHYSPNLLQKGTFLLLNYGNNSDCYVSANNRNTTDKGPFACNGDSGSGLIQFIGPKHRAVIIGVMSGNNQNDGIRNCGDIRSYWTRVSTHIDWILKIMKEN